MEAGISVLICCYNSAKRLPETLKHLALQTVPPNIPWEVIVIDNASTDDTFIAANKICEGFTPASVNFKVLKESTPGKGYAFARGVNEAKFDYLLICDDDNWLANNYLATAFQIMSTDENIGVLGGCGVIEAEQPAVIDDKMLLQTTAHGPQTWAETDHWVYGAGSIYKRGILIDLMDKGWEPLTIGRTGSSLISGEDTEMCFMIYLCGYKIVADNRLLFKHFVPLKRQSSKFILDMAFWLSYSYFFLYSYIVIINKEENSLQQIISFLLKQKTKAVCRQVLKLLFQSLTQLRRPTFEQKKALQADYGMFCSIIRNRKKVVRYHNHLTEVLTQLQPIGV